MASERPTRRDDLDRLRDVLSHGHGCVAILMHDYPDPDCLGAGLGLRRLLMHWNIPSTLIHGGGMGRPENKAMVGLLEIDLTRLDDGHPSGYRGLLLADTQPETGNVSQPPRLPVLGVIDHHPSQDDLLENVPFVDVRPELSASSTIVYGYLREAGVSIDRNLATALYLGIRTDTGNLEREAGPDDVRAYAELLPHVDLPLAAKITRPPLPEEYYAYLELALHDACRFGEALVANVGPVQTPDLLSAISDLLIQSKATAWALAVGWSQKTVYASLRIRPPRKNAGHIVRKMVSDIGTGGGHGLAAGAQIPVGADSCEETSLRVIQRFLQVVGMDREVPRTFSTPHRRKRHDYKTIFQPSFSRENVNPPSQSDRKKTP